MNSIFSKMCFVAVLAIFSMTLMSSVEAKADAGQPDGSFKTVIVQGPCTVSGFVTECKEALCQNGELCPTTFDFQPMMTGLGYFNITVGGFKAKITPDWSKYYQSEVPNSDLIFDSGEGSVKSNIKSVNHVRSVCLYHADANTMPTDYVQSIYTFFYNWEE